MGLYTLMLEQPISVLDIAPLTCKLQSYNLRQYRSDRRRELIHVALYMVYLCIYLCANKVIDVIQRNVTVNTVLRISKTNVLRHCFMCQKVDTEKGS